MRTKRLLIVVPTCRRYVSNAVYTMAFERDTLFAATHPAVGAKVDFVGPVGPPDTVLPQSIHVLPYEQDVAKLFRYGFDAGYQYVCVMGTDTPHLPPALLQEAFGRMEPSPVTGAGVDAVWVPLQSGMWERGQCGLLGLRAGHTSLLDIPRTELLPTVDALTARAQAVGLTYHALPTWYAVHDHERLRRDLLRQVVIAPTTAKDFLGLSL